MKRFTKSSDITNFNPFRWNSFGIETEIELTFQFAITLKAFFVLAQHQLRCNVFPFFIFRIKHQVKGMYRYKSFVFFIFYEICSSVPHKIYCVSPFNKMWVQTKLKKNTAQDDQMHHTQCTEYSNAVGNSTFRHK